MYKRRNIMLSFKGLGYLIVLGFCALLAYLLFENRNFTRNTPGYQIVQNTAIVLLVSIVLSLLFIGLGKERKAHYF